MSRRFFTFRPNLFLLTVWGLIGAGVAVPAVSAETAPPSTTPSTELTQSTVPLQGMLPVPAPDAAQPVDLAIPSESVPLETYLQSQPSSTATDLAQVDSPSSEEEEPEVIPGVQQPLGVFREPRENIDSPTFTIFNWIAPTTVLQGAQRRRVVTTSIKTTGLALLGGFVVPLGEETHLGLTLEGGESILAFDLGFISAAEQPRSGFGANIFGQRSELGTYANGDNEIDLPNGDTPWIHRLGGGVEYYLPFANNFESAIGVSYQRVSVRDDFFSDAIFAEDEEGNAFTVDSDGIDDLLTLNFAATLDNRNTPDYTTDGNLLRFGVNQGFNLGEESNAYTQFVGYYAEYIPVDFFGFDEGPRVLILNVQGGLGLGDVPSYEGFNLGGRSSVRGYASGEISTAASFFQATAEYRFPVATFQFRDLPVFMRGAIFADFATDFGTADQVVGEPAVARDKPGDGFGFGVGLHTSLEDFFNRFEIGVSDSGDVDVIMTFGDRF